MSLPKGVAQTVTITLLDAGRLGVTGATVETSISKDGGTFALTTNSAVEVDGGVGQYNVALTADERNADEVVIFATDGVNGTCITHYPPLGDYAKPGDTMVPSVVTPATDLSGLATAVQADLIRDLLESDRAVDTAAKTITWYRRGTADVLLTQTYDDVGADQGVTSE